MGPEKENTPTGCVAPETGHKHPVTPLAACVSMITTAIGVGVLLLPYLYTPIGYLEGILWTMLAAFMLGTMCIVYVHSLQLAAELQASDETSDPNQRLYRMEDLAEFCFSRWFFWVVIVVVNFTAFSINLSFHILLGDLLTGMARLGDHSEVYWKLICVAPLTFLCLPRDMRIIAKFGFLGVVGVVTVIIAMSIASAQAISNHEASGSHRAQFVVSGQSLKDSLDGMSTFVFSCGCLLVIPGLYQDMGESARPKLPVSITVAHFTIVLVFLAIAIPGYAAFGDQAASQYLDPSGLVHENYYGAWLAGTIAVLIHAFVVYPLLMNGPIRAIEDFLPDGLVYRLAIRCALVWATFGLACTPISFFSEIVGLVRTSYDFRYIRAHLAPVVFLEAFIHIPATLMGVIAILWPPTFYWQLLRRKHGSLEGALRPTSRKLIFALHLFIVFVAVVAIIFGIWGAIDSLIDKLNED